MCVAPPRTFGVSATLWRCRSKHHDLTSRHVFNRNVKSEFAHGVVHRNAMRVLALISKEDRHSSHEKLWSCCLFRSILGCPPLGDGARFCIGSRNYANVRSLVWRGVEAARSRCCGFKNQILHATVPQELQPSYPKDQARASGSRSRCASFDMCTKSCGNGL